MYVLLLVRGYRHFDKAIANATTCNCCVSSKHDYICHCVMLTDTVNAKPVRPLRRCTFIE